MAQFAIDEILTTGIQISGFVFDVSNNIGTNGYVLTSTSSGVMWQQDSSNADLSALSGQIAATGSLLNNRINSLSGYVNGTFISGSGIQNYVPRWNSARELVTGSIYDLGTGVGIGTTSPAAKLNVYGGNTIFRNDVAAGASAVFIRNWAANPTTSLTFGNNPDDDSSAALDLTANVFSITNYGDPGSFIKFGTRNDSTADIRVTIDPSGRVGIGAANPSTLLVVGGAGSTSAASGITFGADSSANLYRSAAGALKTDASLGIGINPVQKLQVEGVVGNPASIAATQSGIFRISNTTDNAVLDFGIRAGGLGAWIQSTDETALDYNYPLLLNPNGARVGIGLTTSISGILHVRTLAAGDQTLLVLEHSAGYGNNTENRIDFFDDEPHKIAARIAQFYSTDSNNRWGLKFYTNPSAAINSIPALTLRGNNNVGIASTNPNTSLRVNGSFSQRASGNTAIQEYKNITTFNYDGYSNGGYVVKTPFRIGSTYEMSIVHVKGYGYGGSTLYDFKVVFYDYEPSNAPINYSIVDLGNDGSPKYLAKDSNNYIQVCFGQTGDVNYYYRFTVDCITTRYDNDFSQGWGMYQTTGANFGFASTGIYQLNSPLNFRTNLNVGLGTTNPQNKLSVIGSVNIGSNNFNTAAPTNGLIIEGNAGIGLTNPVTYINGDPTSFRPNPAGKFLDIYSSTNEASINLITNNSGDGSGIGGLYFTRARGQSDNHYQIAAIKGLQDGTNGLIAGGKLYFYTKQNGSNTLLTSPAMVINSNADVGIGTTQPGGRLHVSGSNGPVLYLNQGVTGAQGGLYFQNVDQFALSSARLYFISGDSVLFTRGPSNLAWAVSQNANVGIGVTNPSEKLTITGAVKILTRDGANFKVGDGSNNSTFLEFDYPDISTSGAYFRIFRNTNTVGGKYFQIFKGDGTATSQTLLNANGDSHINAIAGNLGIGTDSPNHLLNLNTVTADTSIGLYTSNANSNARNWLISANDLAYGDFSLRQSLAISGNPRTSGVSRFYINNNGNVGIATTSPGYSLQIGQNASGNNIDYSLGILRHGTLTYPGSWTSNPAFKITDLSDGGPSNVDIYGLINLELPRFQASDTNAEKASLFLISFDTALGPLRIDGKGNTWIGYDRVVTGVNNSSFSSLIYGGLAVGDAYQTTTLSNGQAIFQGNVGIGTNSPTYKLDVIGTVRASGELISEGNNARISLFRLGGINYFDWASGQSLYFSTQSSAGGAGRNTLMSITSGGNIGIGTVSPVQKLDINGSIYINNNASYLYGKTTGSAATRMLGINSLNDFYIGSVDQPVSSIRINNNGSDRVLIDSSGNVGINTTAPSYKLEVNGNASFTKEVYFQNQSFAYFFGRTGFVNKGTILFNNGSAQNLVFGEIANNIYSFGPGNSGAAPTSNTLTLDNANVNVGIGITNPSGKLHLTSMGFTDQATVSDTNLFPNNTGVFGLVLDGGYTDGRYRHRFIKVDRSANLPLYLQQAGGVADQYLNLVRFGTHSQSTDTFEVFGSSKINGSVNITSTLLTSGNVGIGTASPAYQLTVIGANQATANLTDAGVKGGSVLVASSVNAFNQGGAVLFATKNDAGLYTPQTAIKSLFQNGMGYGIGDLAFSSRLATGDTNLTEVLRIKYDGKVGIGTTNPNEKLEVQGNIQIGNDSLTNVGLKITRLNGGMRTSEHTYHSSQNSPWYTYGQNLTWTNELAGTVESTQAYRPYVEGFAPAAGYKIFGFMNVTTGSFTSANLVNSLVLKNDGNVGINTTNPTQKLEVSGTVKVQSAGTYSDPTDNAAFLNYDTNGGIFTLSARSNAGNTYMAFRTSNGGTGSEKVRITNNGNVGISSVTPSSTLDVAGTVRFDSLGASETRSVVNQAGQRIFMPSGGAKFLGNSSTGAIRIKSPINGHTDSMHTIKGTVFEYVTGKTFQFVVSFYYYLTSISQVTAQIIGGSNASLNRNFTVRVGRDANNAFLIYIGELADVWTYSYVYITEVFFGWSMSQANIDAYQTGWSISTEASAFENVMATIADTQITNWSRNATSTYYNLGNVGIQTSSPLAPLHVGLGGDWPSTTGSQAMLFIKQKVGNAGLVIQEPGDASLDKVLNLYVNNSIATIEATYRDTGPYPHLGFVTSGIERVRINSTGNVGIGLLNPQKPLDVISSANDFVTLGARILGVGEWAGVHFGYREDNNLYRKSAIVFERTDRTSSNAQGKVHILNGPIVGAGNATLADSKITIDESGKVGIGTTNPIYNLDVVGPATANGVTLRLRDTASLADSRHILITRNAVQASIGIAGSQVNDPLWITRSSGYDLMIDLNGKVGIGTNNPTTLLSVGGAGSTTAASGITFGSDAQANLYRNSASTLRTDGALIAGNYLRALSYIQFLTNLYPDSYTDNFNINIGNLAGNSWETAIKVKPGSYVGIGTTQPTGKLHVVSNIAGETVLRLDGTNGTLLSVVDDLSDSLFSVNNGAGLPVLEVFADDRIVAGQYGSGDFVLTNNKIGIGTTNPINKLSVIGAASIGSNSYNTVAPTNGLIVEGKVGIGVSSVESWAQFKVIGTSALGGIVYVTDKIQALTAFPGSATKLQLNPDGGNVGINTTNPITRLHVDLATGESILANISSNSISTSNKVGFKLSELGTASAEFSLVRDGTSYQAKLQTLNNQPLSFGTNTTTRMVIDINGNIGIGITNPVQKLQVDGTVGNPASGLTTQSGIFRISNTTDNAVLDFGIRAGGNGAWIQSTDETDLSANYPLLLNPNGANVGIGTSSPLTVLDVRYKNTSNAASQVAGMTLRTNQNGGLEWHLSQSSNSYVGWVAGARVNSYGGNWGQGYLEFITAGAGGAVTSTMTLNSGYVGIGTTSPVGSLHVEGNFVMSRVSVLNSSKFSINGDGTNPIFSLQLNSTTATVSVIDLYNAGGTNFAAIKGDTSNKDLTFNVGPSSALERVRINSTGYVGIGTSGPVAQLHIGGSASNNNPWAVLDVNDTYFKRIVFSEERLGYGTLAYGGYIGYDAAANTVSLGTYNNSTEYRSLNILRDNGYVGIGTTQPLNRLSVISSNSTNYYNATAPVAVFQGVSPSTVLIAVDGNVDGYFSELRLGNAQSTYYPYSAYVRGIQGAGIDYYRLEFGTANGSAASTRMTIANNGNIGIGLTNTTDKIQISGGGISFTTSTGLAVPMLGLTALNIAYVGPYATSTDGNAPSTVLFNHGASVQQTWFYSSGSVAMVLNRQGRLHIGNINNTPNSLLSVGPSSSTTAVSGMCFGNDASANWYRSATATIKTDGDLIVVGNVTAANLVSGNGTANYITKWNGTKSIANSQIFDDGTYVGINTISNTTYRLQVNGSFAATTKSFDITHPTISGKRLVYASLEGPENGVYFRGRNNNNEINLPHYWSGLVHEDSITANLTSIGKRKDGRIRNYSVDQIGHNKVYIYTDSDDNIYDYYYTIFAERKDVSKLVIERDME